MIAIDSKQICRIMRWGGRGSVIEWDCSLNSSYCGKIIHMLNGRNNSHRVTLVLVAILERRKTRPRRGAAEAPTSTAGEARRPHRYPRAHANDSPPAHPPPSRPARRGRPSPLLIAQFTTAQQTPPAPQQRTNTVARYTVLSSTPVIVS